MGDNILIIVLTLVLSITGLLGGEPATNTPRPPALTQEKEVIGYYLSDGRNDYLSVIEPASRVLTTISPWAFRVTPQGKVIPATDPTRLGKLLDYVGRKRIATLAMVTNYVPHRGFDSQLARTVLTNPTIRERLFQSIVTAAREWGVSGITIDFENVRPEDGRALTTFVSRLSRALHNADLTLAIALPAKTREDWSSAWSGAFDYAALGTHADLVMLMTYDQHYKSGPPGPIASLPWVERVVRYAQSKIPRQKIILGLPGYGYDWPLSGGRAVTRTYRDVSKLTANGSVYWDNQAQVPYLIYPGRQVWFENSDSLGKKTELVEKYGLRGIALWRLGQEDQKLWPLIGSEFGRKP